MKKIKEIKFKNPSWNFYIDKLNSYAYWEK